VTVVERANNQPVIHKNRKQDKTDPLAGGCKTAGFPALVDSVADPVDSGIPTNGLVVGVDEDDLEVLVDTVLVDPVRLL
jgi:hypothetical protein